MDLPKTVAPRHSKIKVLVADDDTPLARSIVSLLQDNGFAAEFCTTGRDAKELILRWNPRVILADLMLPEGNGLEILSFVKNQPLLKGQKIDVCLMSGHNDPDNVKQAFAHGATDYIVKPIRPIDILSRIILLVRSHQRDLADPSAHEMRPESAAYWLQITNLMISQAISEGRMEDKLYNLTRMAAIKVKGLRCSVVRVLQLATGVVVTSNDDANAAGIELNLVKYPEIQMVTNSGKTLAVDDIESSPELRKIRKNLKSFTFNSLIVCPIYYRGQMFGVLSIRMGANQKALSENEIRFMEVTSKIISLMLSAQDSMWVEAQIPRVA